MKVQIFDQNDGLTPFEKMQIFRLFENDLFYSLERLIFSLKHYLEVFPGVFSIKTNMHESSNF